MFEDSSTNYLESLKYDLVDAYVHRKRRDLVKKIIKNV